MAFALLFFRLSLHFSVCLSPGASYFLDLSCRFCLPNRLPLSACLACLSSEPRNYVERTPRSGCLACLWLRSEALTLCPRVSRTAMLLQHLLFYIPGSPSNRRMIHCDPLIHVNRFTTIHSHESHILGRWIYISTYGPKSTLLLGLSASDPPAIPSFLSLNVTIWIMSDPEHSSSLGCYTPSPRTTLPSGVM